MKVRDAMTGDVLTFTPGRSLRAAAKFMADHNVGAVVIIDPEHPAPDQSPSVISSARSARRGSGHRARLRAPHLERGVRRHRVGPRRGRRRDGQGRLPASRRRRRRRIVRDHLDAGHHAGLAAERAPESRDVALSFLSLLTGSSPRRPPRTRPSRWSRPRTATSARRALHQLRRHSGRVGRRRRGARRWAGRASCSLPHKVAVIEHWTGSRNRRQSSARSTASSTARALDRREHGRQGVRSSLRTVVDPAGTPRPVRRRRRRAGDRGRVRPRRRERSRSSIATPGGAQVSRAGLPG